MSYIEETMDFPSMLKEKIVEVFRQVAAGRGDHGDFLKSFAESVTRADPENFELIRVPAIFLIGKYKLYRYLDDPWAGDKAAEELIKAATGPLTAEEHNQFPKGRW